MEFYGNSMFEYEVRMNEIFYHLMHETITNLSQAPDAVFGSDPDNIFVLGDAQGRAYLHPLCQNAIRHERSDLERGVVDGYYVGLVVLQSQRGLVELQRGFEKGLALVTNKPRF